MDPFEICILTTPESGTPHIAALREANPDTRIHVHFTPRTADKEGWRNCDRNLRAWWRTNRGIVDSPGVIFLEWDVFANVPLASVIRPSGGLSAARIARPNRDTGWPVFTETARLPREMRGFAAGAVPFAVLHVTREALDAASSPQWDTLFAADIFCELRFPTLLRFLGWQLGELRGLCHVGVTPVSVPQGFHGVIHPVKMEVRR